MKEQGASPVIFFSFRGAKMNDWEDTSRMIIFEIAREFKRHNDLLQSGLFSLAEKEKFIKLFFDNPYIS